MSLDGSGFTGFKQGDSKPTRRRKVLELGTHGRPLEQSDRVNASRVWAGGQVGWTALGASITGVNNNEYGKTRRHVELHIGQELHF